MKFLYSAVMAVALILSLPFWLLRMLRHGKYRDGLGERLGRVPARLVPAGDTRTIWVHAVSVGEVLAAGAIIREFYARFPEHRVVISTTTATGQKLARQRFGDANVFYFPLDFAFALRPYFQTLRPELVVVVETELWPNFFRLARAYGSRLAVINARVSDQSFPRYRLVSRLLSRALACVDLFLAQSRQDAGRLVAIGAPPERVEAVGNLKFDIPAGSDSPLVEQLRGAVPGPVWVCGSTVEGEEPLLLAAFRSLRSRFPGMLMVLAPRHPERFAAVAQLIASSGESFVRRSEWGGQSLSAGILLLDSIGELADLYQVANLAFIGGSLVPRGGHNILEAARFGVPILVGRHTENFREIVSTFEQAGAVRTIDAADLAAAVEDLLAHPDIARDIGVRARETWRRNTGATARTFAYLQSLLPRQARVIEMPRRENA
jgi:3-deoxy-D-manno-octulosonic-acid transferase